MESHMYASIRYMYTILVKITQYDDNLIMMCKHDLLMGQLDYFDRTTSIFQLYSFHFILSTSIILIHNVSPHELNPRDKIGAE